MEPSDVIVPSQDGIIAEIDRLLAILDELLGKMDNHSIVYHDTSLHHSNLTLARFILTERGEDYEPKAWRMVKNARIYTRALQWKGE